uniref:Claudin n=1 Tax=Lates calcarifer TaxID=8187 RepID=A0A4W6CJN4_LATCA
MGSEGVQIACFTFGVLGMLGIMMCCVVPRWKVSSFTESNIVTAQSSQEGLWMNCVVQSTGQQQCKNYDSLLVLPSDLKAARTMTIIASIVSCLSLLILFTTCVQNEDAKPKISLVAGVGLWSAHIVVRDFNNPLVSQTQKKELGACIFIGWAAGVLLLLGGGLLCCFSRPNSGSSGGTSTTFNACSPALSHAWSAPLSLL